METQTPNYLNNNKNKTKVTGDNAVVLNFNPASIVVHGQTGADSKIRRQMSKHYGFHPHIFKLERLYTLLDPLESSTRMGINVPKDGCLVGTRLELLQQISSFASDKNPPHTCLILGLAGMGVWGYAGGFLMER